MNPNIFIVGAAKAATTTLHDYLNCHPEIYMSKIKEPHYFFDFTCRESVHDGFVTCPNEYFSLFSGCKSLYAGESSTGYLWSASAPQKIYDVSPDSKVIIVLRDPVERCLSHFLMDCRDGKQEFIDEQGMLEVINKDSLIEPKGWYSSNLYVEMGLYAEQVSNYVSVFGRDNVKIVFFDDVVSDISRVGLDVFSFLGLDDVVGGQFSVSNSNQYGEVRFKFLFNLFSRSRGFLNRLKSVLPRGVVVFFKRFIYRNLAKPNISSCSKKYLYGLYSDDLERLKLVLGDDSRIEFWMNKYK